MLRGVSFDVSLVVASGVSIVALIVVPAVVYITVLRVVLVRGCIACCPDCCIG